jgi:hypothetical protein
MSVRKPTSSRLDSQIKKLQKILEDPKTDRDKTIKTREELKKLKASVQPNPLSAKRKDIKPKKNVAAEARERAAKLHGITIGRPSVLKTKKPGEKLKEVKTTKKAPSKKVVSKKDSSKKAPPRPAPPSNRGGRAINDPRYQAALARRDKKERSKVDIEGLGRTPTKTTAPKKVARPKIKEPKRFQARPATAPKKVARPTIKDTAGTGIPHAIPSGGRRIQPSPTRKAARVISEKDFVAGQKGLVPVKKPKKPARVISEKDFVAGQKGLVPVKKPKKPARVISEKDFVAGQKGLVPVKKPKKSTFGFKQISGPTDWSGGKKEYETPWGNIKIDSRSYEETLSPQEREELEAYKKGGKIGKKKKKVGKKKQGYKARKDESIAMRVKKKRTKKKLKASRDESYGKWGSKKGKGKINRSSGSALVASSYD